MTDRKPPKAESLEDFVASWMKAAAEFWGMMGKADPASKTPSPDTAFTRTAGRMEEFWASSRKLWEASVKAMGEPGSAERLQRGLQTVPDISMRLAQKSLEGFFEFQKRWADHMQKLGAPSEPYRSSDFDPDFLKRLTDIYKKEFQKFLEIPQVGLTRFYQERFNQALKKWNQYQAALTEFLQLICLPIEKSYRLMLDKLAELTQGGRFPDEPKHYYQLWIKTLEGHYMTLFQSQQYTETLVRTIDALNQFLAARSSVLEDALRLLPVCTHRDLDDVSGEIYQLKRRIRALEKGRHDPAEE